MDELADPFGVPLYNAAEAAQILDLPSTTFRNWARGYKDARKRQHSALVTSLPSRRAEPSIPFVGLSEGLVLSAFRESGVPMQRIRPALQRLKEEIGLEHALASNRLFTDGAEILYDYGQSDQRGAKDVQSLVVLRNGQHVLNEVVEAYLRQIEFGQNGYARLVHVPRYAGSGVDVVVDPLRGFGQPIVAKNAVRVSDIVSRVWAGDTIGMVADDYGLTEIEVGELVGAEPYAA